MRSMMSLVLLLAVSALQAGAGDTLVAWAPGYPGNTQQAQETMDRFALGVARAAGIEADDLRAIYHNTLEGGLRALESDGASLALVPAPVLAEYGTRLDLTPFLLAVDEDGPDEIWSLVAAKGRVRSADALEGWTIVGSPGYAPQFVRSTVLADWGKLPGSTAIEFSGSIRSALRRVAAGDNLAVLIDAAQAEALGALRFADQLEIVNRSRPLPATFLCRVGSTLDGQRELSIRNALLRLHQTDDGPELLGSIRLRSFQHVPGDALARLGLTSSDDR